MSFILENSIGFFGCSHYCYKGTYKVSSQHINEEIPKKCFISAISRDALLVDKRSAADDIVFQQHTNGLL